MSKTYDVAIVGAGPGGSSAAHYLAKAGLDVLLLDKADFPRDKTCGDGLTPRALKILDDMGILDQSRKAGFQINGLELHARSGAQMFTSIPKHSEYPDHLLVVPRFKLDNIIRRRAIKSGAHFESPVRVRHMEYEEKFVRILAHKGRQKHSYQAKVIIMAIGANIRLLQQLNILKRKPKLIMATRAYFENMTGLTDRIQAHFADIPLPGYGWVFPISKTAANVGLGYWPSKMPFRRKPSSARSELKLFLDSPKMREMIKDGHMQGAIRSYPLRIDFSTSPTFGERILLVGESAGLVSPLSGEGIDFALESGQLAAQFLIERFPTGDFSRRVLMRYDKLLRTHFQSIFRFLNLVRRFYVNPILMDRMITVSEKRPEIKRLLINILISQQHPAAILSPQVIRSVLLGA